MAKLHQMVLVASCAGGAAGANPIRKVVNMLQNMITKVEEEGKQQEILFNKFVCYCKTGTGSLVKAIADAEDKAPKVSNAIAQIEAKLKQLQADLDAAKAERVEAQSSLKEAKALREKELEAFTQTTDDMKANIAAMGKALVALERGAGGGFLQTSAASILKKVLDTMDISADDHEMVVAFLSAKEVHQYAPQSGQITGILKQMKETLEGELASAQEEEAKSVAQFEALAKAKAKQIAGLGAEIESKTRRQGDAGVELVEMKADLSDTQEQLLEDKKFLAGLQDSCATKEGEWAEISKTRAAEIVALHETIKILNDDDSLELFKKTLPSPSLMQKGNRHAVESLGSTDDVRMNLITLALRGKKFSMEKVVKMIDDMVNLLGIEQNDDDNKKKYCEKHLDQTQDEIKEIERHVADVERASKEAEDSLSTLSSEIQALSVGVADLDKQVAAATEQRKQENADFTAALAANSAAIELLGIAKNRLNKFYNPSLYKPPPKQELTKADRVAVNLGLGTPPPVVATGIAGTGVTVLAQSNLGPAPVVGGYQEKGAESNGVITLLDLLVADVKKEMQESDVEERHAQKEYEELAKDAAAKRASDLQSIKDKTGAKADVEARLLEYKEETASGKKAAMEKVEVLGELHSSCDWLLKNFDIRRSARSAEIESLNKAKAVLSGADYALL